jgi:mono/diheme cytochrome c family protein
VIIAAQSGRGTAAILWILAMLAGLALIVCAYMVFGPRPTDFAGGKHVPLTEYQPLDPTGVPATLKSAGLVVRGEYLTRAADCAACHTTEGGEPFAGGRAFVLPFGTLYSTNITPDGETGIGGYTDANFLDAVHRGIGRGNTKLYPAMPYASYTYMTDADALAIKAYLFTLKPVYAPARRNSLIFPFNQRSLMSLWSALFDPDTRYEPIVDRSAEWNRGAYLVEAMGHCGECHTPRNLFFALNNRRKFAGAVQAGWRAYNITPDRRSGVGAWSDAELANYLSMGHADGRGSAAGPMGEAVDASLAHLEPSDIAAVVTYLRSVAAVTESDVPEPKLAAAPSSDVDSAAVTVDARGKQVYEGACIGCHGWSGVGAATPFATLIGTRDINDPAATNVAQVIIVGGMRRTAIDADNMPAFGSTYSDAEIAAVANYVTARFGAQGSHLTTASIAKLRAAD